MRSVLSLLVLQLTTIWAFFPASTRLGTTLNHLGSSPQSPTECKAVATERNVLKSKLLPPMSESELSELLREFNITSLDIANDPEFSKWSPSKQFFELYGFQNHTMRYKRKVTDVKTDFYANYRNPILPNYKTFIADLLSVTFIQSVDARYKYDALHAFGMCTQYYTIMKGYALSDEIDVIFNEMMKAIGFNPVVIREDAKRILNLIKESIPSTLSENDFLNLDTNNELGQIFHNVRSNRFFKYCDAWGVGLGRIMELRGIEPNDESFDRWSTSLRWVYSTRLMQSWSEFCADQLRMQGIEALQKQLLIREKKRAAERLESKAAAFDGKKKALMDMNRAIAERREEMISNSKETKKKFEPDAYAQLLGDSKVEDAMT